MIKITILSLYFIYQSRCLCFFFAKLETRSSDPFTGESLKPLLIISNFELVKIYPFKM